MYPRKTVGVACLITALAMLAGCQQPQQSVDADATSAEPLKMDVEPVSATPPTAKAGARKPVAKTAATKSAPAKAAETKSATSGTPGVDKATPGTPVLESRSVAMRQEEEAIATTISGCLVEDDGMFHLKDTDGDYAPKSRSWKSGFIRKGSAKIDLFDAGNRFKLMSHVGYRVSVSGNLVDREMHARSVRVSSERCD